MKNRTNAYEGNKRMERLQKSIESCFTVHIEIEVTKKVDFL